MTDTPPPLDIDPGPTLPVDVIELSDYDENTAGFLVRGTRDEALARRLVQQHVAQQYDTDDALFYHERLAATTTIATASNWVELTPSRDDDFTEYMDADSLVSTLAERTVSLSPVFPGIRFILDTERDD